MAQFLAELARADLSPATVRGYRYDLRHFLAARSPLECLKPIAAEILALSAEIRTSTIDRIMEMSDAELDLKALLGQLPRPF
jgi:hypothetical protein